MQIHPIVVYSFFWVLISLLFILLSRFILRGEIKQEHIIAWVIAGLILRLALSPIHPIGSDDYYRYLWDGKVIANGINPYRYAATDPALSGLHSQSLPARINHADMKTIYPPLAEIMFYLAYTIGGESYLGLKALLLLCDVSAILGIFLILRRLDLRPQNILLYVLCPLPLFQFFIDGHMDGFGVPLLVFGILSYLKDKKTLSYLLIGLSISVKPLGLILMPILFFQEKELLERIKIVLVPAAICAILYSPFVFSGSPFQALIAFTENWTFNGILFDFLNIFFNDNQRTRMICAAMLLLFYLPVVFSKKDMLTKLYLSVILLLICSPVVHPWYLSWAAFLLPLQPRWSGIAYVSLISMTSFTLITYQFTGVWKEYAIVLIIEYVPVLSLFLYELIHRPRLQFENKSL